MLTLGLLLNAEGQDFPSGHWPALLCGPGFMAFWHPWLTRRFMQHYGGTLPIGNKLHGMPVLLMQKKVTKYFSGF